ncbi:MAG: hypothetical protein ABFC56_11835 [Clostridiaceae bacterium]
MVKKLLPHICFIFSLVTLTFLVLDQFNPTLFGKSFFHVELLIFCLAAMILSVSIITRKKKKKQSSHEQQNNPRSRNY